MVSQYALKMRGQVLSEGLQFVNQGLVQFGRCVQQLGATWFRGGGPIIYWCGFSWAGDKLLQEILAGGRL